MAQEKSQQPVLEEFAARRGARVNANMEKAIRVSRSERGA